MTDLTMGTFMKICFEKHANVKPVSESSST